MNETRRDAILIVDDVELNRAVLCEVFRNDYVIFEAENGQEAIKVLKKIGERTAAILLDVLMPVMDGLETLRKLKEAGVLETIPVFLITADGSERNIQCGYEMGAMDVIRKPIMPDFVRRRVCSIIELYQARESLSQRVERQEKLIAQRQHEIQELNSSVIELLATAIEFRDHESGEHVNRIHDLTHLLLCSLREMGAERCQFSDEQIEQIATAAILHDVGKIAIPDYILNKPGRLTPEEYEVMKTHTVRGCELLNQVKQLHGNPVYEYALDICRHHHERWDGRGYPDHLKGDQITVWSQVVSLADVYDALVSRRVYKESYTHAQAMRMILNGECGRFNPELLKSLEKVQDRIERAIVERAAAMA